MVFLLKNVYSKIPIFNLFNELGKLTISVRGTFKNPNFQSLCELERFKSQKFKTPNFESTDGLGKGLV